jgi:hypothetical protein
VVTWQSRAHLEDHFAKHGVEVGTQTVEEYDASARAVLARADIIFGYDDPETGLRRVGHYDSATGLLTALNEYDKIVTHFRTDSRYVRRLRRNSE